MDVFVIDVKDERAHIDLGLNRRETAGDGFIIRLGDDSLLSEHRGMCARTGDILFIQMLIDGKRCAELLRGHIHAALEPSAPKCHISALLR